MLPTLSVTCFLYSVCVEAGAYILPMLNCENEVGRAMMQASGYKREVPRVWGVGASEMLDP